MNGRVIHEGTPARRIAAAFFTLINTWVHPPPQNLDYADITERLEPLIERERLLAKIEQEEFPISIHKLNEELDNVSRKVRMDPTWRIGRHT